MMPTSTCRSRLLIDRMIDGEMSPQQLRTCIERLDSAPEGWRQCALAFLEAQSWGEAFRDLDEACREQGLAGGHSRPWCRPLALPRFLEAGSEPRWRPGSPSSRFQWAG